MIISPPSSHHRAIWPRATPSGSYLKRHNRSIPGPNRGGHTQDEATPSNPLEVMTAGPRRFIALEITPVYSSLGERPIPLCDSNPSVASAKHRNGYRRHYGTNVAPCKSPGQAPLERNYPRFATTAPTAKDIMRMFGSHQGNIGGVVPAGRVVLDIDPLSGGPESMAALTERQSPFPEMPALRTGGNGFHNHFLLPAGVTVPSGGSLAPRDTLGWNGRDPAARWCCRPQCTRRAACLEEKPARVWQRDLTAKVQSLLSNKSEYSDRRSTNQTSKPYG